jgi:hypothetical protein
MNKNAISIGIDTGIGVELRRRFDSTLGQPLLDSTFGPALAEEGSNTGWAELYIGARITARTRFRATTFP